jgi:basic membrane lipoprotein Med (substrate-binding protein (PBP1-ABC) superfamily)
MYDNGVDIIFAAAGGSGSGVHEAAAHPRSDFVI